MELVSVANYFYCKDKCTFSYMSFQYLRAVRAQVGVKYDDSLPSSYFDLISRLILKIVGLKAAA